MVRANAVAWRTRSRRSGTLSAWQRRAVALAVAVAAAGMAATPALANPAFNITVYNKTTNADVNLIKARGEKCWLTKDLDHPLDQKIVSPGRDFLYVTGKENKGNCGDHDGERGIDLMVREPGGSWYLPDGSPSAYKIYFKANMGSSDHSPGFGFQFRDSLPTWVPRKDGKGLICWHTATYTSPNNNATAIGHASIYVYSGAHCNTAVSSTILPTSPPLTEQKANGASAGLFAAAGGSDWLLARPVADPGPGAAPDAAARAAAGSVEVVDLLSTIGVACPWYSYPNDTGLCNSYNVGSDAKWHIDNLTSDIREFHITNSVGTNDPKTSVATGSVSIPKTSGKGTVSVSKAVATAETSTTSTQHGGKVGVKIGFKQSAEAKIPFFSTGGKVEFSQEFSSEYSYTKTATETTTKTETRTVSISAEATPGFTTTLDVFTQARRANYTYKADLDLGSTATVQAVYTPANPALNQSPAFRQPCLEYAIGNQSVRNSIMFTGQQLLDAGYSPTEPTLAPERRAFLASVPYFRTSGAPCPGFPSGYASQAGFKGEGVGTYENLGYDEKGNPVKVMTGCVYQSPYPPTSALANSKLQSPSVPPTSSDSPCQTVPISGGEVHGETPGLLIDARHGPGSASRDARDPIIAPPGSNEILGPNAGATIYTNNGALDIVYAGRGPTHEFGGSGENLLYGGAGHDTLTGGHGANILEAGSGNTLLQERDGSAIMYGGKGSDTFEGHNMQGVMVGGSGPSRMIGTGNLAKLQMEGGTGSDLYVLSGDGTPRIVQLPERAGSTIETSHSLAVPMYVKTGIATGSQPVRLTGSVGTQALVANGGADTLVSGPGAETLRGGRGPDTIVFNPDNDDVAIGGSGADRYEFTGSPETTMRPAALAYPADRTAATITNFNPHKGDRLVLSTAVFGSALTQLDRHFKVVVAPNPRPRGRGATLLLSTRTGVLSFDPDGTGPISDKVIAKLPGVRTIERGWVVIV